MYYHGDTERQSGRADCRKAGEACQEKYLEEHLQEHPELFAPDNLEDLFKQAEYSSISDQQFEKLAADVFRGRKTAAQLVAEGRERQ
jgi:hypothetical protein